jgi:hypothetical protein
MVIRRQEWDRTGLTDSLEDPATPVKLLTPALVTRDDICLQARAMLLRTVANSASRVPFASSCTLYTPESDHPMSSSEFSAPNAARPLMRTDMILRKAVTWDNNHPFLPARSIFNCNLTLSDTP